MTKHTEVGRQGCVALTLVEAEFLDTPPQYMLDCDHAPKCEWGMAGVTDKDAAERYASEHSAFHEEHGADSTAWRDNISE